MANFEIKDIKGVIPALITTFDENENFDEKRMRAVVEHLIGKKIDGLYLTGSTGEGFLMTPEERKKVVEVVIEQTAGRVPIIVHVGAIGTKISIDLAKHAEQCGADAISSVPPFYWRFDADSVFNYYKDITESTSLPMIVYNIMLAGLQSYEQVKRFAQIEGVKGLKFTATSHYDVMRLKEDLGEDFLIYSGSDEMSMSGLAFGADGLIGSFYNLMPEVFIDIYNAMNNNDLPLAKEKQKFANAIIMFAVQKNYLGIMKRALSWMGIDAGYCRRPFENYTLEDEEVMKKDFRALKKRHSIAGIDFLDAI